MFRYLHPRLNTYYNKVKKQSTVYFFQKYKEFSTSNNEIDPMEAMRREFEGIEVVDSQNSQMNDEDHMKDIFGMNISDNNLPQIPLKTATGVHWASSDDPANPFNMNILNLSPLIDSSTLGLIINETMSDKPASEVLESFKELKRGLEKTGLNNPQTNESDKDVFMNETSEESFKKDVLDKEDDVTRTQVSQSLCTFDKPFTVAYPVPASMFEEISEMFSRKSKHLLNEVLDPLKKAMSVLNPAEGNPKMKVLQKASMSGGRFDAYLAGDDGDIMFFTTNVTPLSLKKAKQAQLDKYNITKAKAIEHNRTIPDLFVEHLCTERHHVIILAGPPTIIPAPLVIQQFNQLSKSDNNEFDPITHILKFNVAAVVSTYDVKDPVGPPSNNKEFRATEVEFLIKNILFGATIPAPIDPKYSALVDEDLQGYLSPEEADVRREIIGRVVLAQYGHSSQIAAFMPNVGIPIVDNVSIGADPTLAVLYGDPQLYLRD